MVVVNTMSIHLIVEFMGVEAEKIARVRPLKRILDTVISKSGLKVVSSTFHQFKPYGVSAVYLLKESHLSVHTWPELGYMALDIFTCGDEKCAFKAYELLVREFKPKKIKKKVMRRYGQGVIQR
ncbi:MAG: adenosylmethionine decarboxylase [Candidatus Nanoarchaeia archaeon]|nr:adenosylmethionine decarboxylase [Candidatus Haiyanarchaeum thermophilum]